MDRIIATLALWFLALSIIIGQTIRFPLPGQSGGLLISDIAVVLVLVAAVGQFIFRNSHYSPAPRSFSEVGLLTTPFITWSAFTLVLHTGDYAREELLIAASYWLRTSTYLLLLPALVYLAHQPRIYQTLRRSCVVSIVILVAMGLVQRIFMPHLSDLPAWLVATSGGGWDPHEGRLVSTWLDPNFFGAYLGISLLYSLACLVSAKTKGSKTFFIVLSLVTVVAGILTQSRSSTLALAVTLVILSPIILVRLAKQATPALVPSTVATTSLATVALLIAAVALGDRALGLLTVDATVQQRAEALTATWYIVADHPLVGVGYNAWQFAARDAGLIKDFSAHSRAGADNSWLTLLVTTGFIGLALFSLPWLVAAHLLLRQWLLKGQVVAVAALASLLFLAIHAQFINSFIYGHLLITIAIVLALALASPASYEQTLRH